MLDNIVMAFQSLKANKMRALLTMLGIIIGIGSVIAIETVGNSLIGSIADSMSGFGASDITVTVSEKDADDENTSSDVRMRLFRPSVPDESDLITDDMLADFRLAFSDKVKYIKISENVGNGTYQTDGDSTSLSVVGINDEYIPAEETEILYGRRIFNSSDTGKKLCMVADTFVENYMGISPVNAVGKEISAKINSTPHSFYIVGVYQYTADETLSLSSEDITTEMYIPLSTAKNINGGNKNYSSVTVVSADGTDVPGFVDVTEEYFASYYTLNDSWTAKASSMETLVDTLTEMLDTISLAISAIAAISLLVGGIGVMNIMLVSVTERTKEIGTRKALGAPKNTILMQFIIEAVVICLVGGALGIMLGTGLGAVACNIMGYSARADIESIFMVVAISVAIGVFFGYYPANKASKLDPIEALRYE
ncbi:MAG: ABC transporter permease [Oscillospiraceae bacterium]|nr:ABC transporter permease [Oscillospiraceae bacterium]